MILMPAWYARPATYDYIQSATFREDGSGELFWGQDQFERYRESISYTIKPTNGLSALQLPDYLSSSAGVRRFALSFRGEDKREWSGQVELEEGPYEFVTEGPFPRKIAFQYRLRFSSCPFGFFDGPGSLDYYSLQLPDRGD